MKSIWNNIFIDGELIQEIIDGNTINYYLITNILLSLSFLNQIELAKDFLHINENKAPRSDQNHPSTSL